MKLPDITPIAVALLGVIIPVFIFSVTLLGNAIERAKKEEERVKQEQENEVNTNIEALEAEIATLKTSNNHGNLEEKLIKYKETKKKFENEFNKIKQKYSQLEFKGSILIPGSFFLVSSLCSEMSKTLTTDTNLMLAYWFGAVVFLGMGIHKLSKNLILVQEISASSDELQSRKMTEAVKTAFLAIEKEKEEILIMKFSDISFPYTCKTNKEVTIPFRVSLIQGKLAKNVEVWFKIPDGFGIIDPDEKLEDLWKGKDAVIWRQAADHHIPNIRTIKREIGDIKGRVYTPSNIKIKTPNKPGEYELAYSMLAENCDLPEKKIVIIVE